MCDAARCMELDGYNRSLDGRIRWLAFVVEKVIYVEQLSGKIMEFCWMVIVNSTLYSNIFCVY